MVLHSWGGCRELLLKGSSFFEHNQRAARLWEPLRRGKAAPGASSAAVPWPGQELSLLWGESPFLSSLNALGMLLVLPVTLRARLDGAVLSLVDAPCKACTKPSFGQTQLTAAVPTGQGE